MASSQKDRLRKEGIRHFDELIHDQSKEWLQKYFSKRADEYPINVSMLIKNIIWQTRERIIKKEKPPLKELVRTFWYMYIKPTLSRAGALSKKRDQYNDLVKVLVHLVKEANLLRYKDIGFRDENKRSRKIGGNSNIVMFSEKQGHEDYLGEVAEKYNITVLSLGGQPSVLSSEYFVDELKEMGINIKRSFYIFNIVDYDPSGLIIRNAFLNNLKFYGIKNIRVFDLIYPDILTPEEIMISRYEIPTGKKMEDKNQDWLDEMHKRNYENQKYLEEITKTGKKIYYGLEAESISEKRMNEYLKTHMVPLIGKSEELLRNYELKKLNDAIQKLILHIIVKG